LKLGTGAGDQKCEWWGSRAKKKFDNPPSWQDRWTDRQMDTGRSKDRTYA